jgi:hypothetical protein
MRNIQAVPKIRIRLMIMGNKGQTRVQGGFLPGIVLKSDFDHASRAKGDGQIRRVSFGTGPFPSPVRVSGPF